MIKFMLPEGRHKDDKRWRSIRKLRRKGWMSEMRCRRHKPKFVA
jgi:hypothetical protein